MGEERLLLLAHGLDTSYGTPQNPGTWNVYMEPSQTVQVTFSLLLTHWLSYTLFQKGPLWHSFPPDLFSLVLSKSSFVETGSLYTALEPDLWTVLAVDSVIPCFYFLSAGVIKGMSYSARLYSPNLLPVFVFK